MFYKEISEVNLLIEAFKSQTLPKSEWTHAAHLTVGLYFCYYHPPETAKTLMREGIYKLNDAHATPNTETSGYHETITVFWLQIVRNYLDKTGREKNLAELANGLLAEVNDSLLPLKFYSRERLFSVEARMKYVEPDLNNSSLSTTDPMTVFGN